MSDNLPDVLDDGLDVVFVGTAAGRRSGAAAYYAHTGNAFWRTLAQIGLTPRRYAPRDFPQLREVGIGFTDLAKTVPGMDRELAAGDFDVAAFDAKMLQYRPRAIAFTSKKAASLWLRRRTNRIAYGRQRLRGRSDFPEVFVLSSPSAAARRYWRLNAWRDLADWLRATKPWRF
jgi:TDG/mug DNA glycosylase family protein